MVARSDGRQDFASEVGKSGVAKPSHFMVTFTTPDIEIQGATSSTFSGKNLGNTIGKLFKEEVGKFTRFTQQGFSHMCFRIERINLPGRIILTSPYKEGNIGLVSEYPTNVTYQPIDFTVILSEDYSEKIFFEIWQDLIIGAHRKKGDTNPDGGVRELNYHQNYTCLMSITAFSDAVGFRREMQPVYECILQEAYPRTIQDVPLDWGSNDVARLNVTMQYKYFSDRNISKDSGRERVREASFLNSSGLGAGLSSFGGRQLARVSPGTQSAVVGAVAGVGGAINAARSASNSARVAAKVFR